LTGEAVFAKVLAVKGRATIEEVPMFRRLVALVVLGAALLLVVVASGGAGNPSNENKLKGIEHIVVIYEENHSFDNLYGGWERA
jgi:phospholipase C